MLRSGPLPGSNQRRGNEKAGEMLTKGVRVLVEGTLDVTPDTGKFRVLARTFCKV